MCLWSSRGMPTPLSDTASITWGPGREPTLRRTYSSSRSAFAVSTTSWPPRGIASRALMARFITTCSIWPRSAFTWPRVAARFVTSAISSPMSRASISFMSVMTTPRSSTTASSTCLRLKASSCLVSSAARPAVRWIKRDAAAERVLGLDLGEQDVGASEDDGEEVVEVVGDPAREAADGVHLLGLLELALGLRQLVVGTAGLVEQPAVLEGHRGVGGEGGGDREVLGGEALLAAGEEGEHADHPVAHPRGHREHAVVAQA